MRSTELLVPGGTLDGQLIPYSHGPVVFDESPEPGADGIYPDRGTYQIGKVAFAGQVIRVGWIGDPLTGPPDELMWEHLASDNAKAAQA